MSKAAPAVVEPVGLPAMYNPADLYDALDVSDRQLPKIYLVQKGSRLVEYADARAGSIMQAYSAEDPAAILLAKPDEDVTFYVMSLSKGHVHKVQGSPEMTFLSRADGIEREGERDVWKAYHYIVLAEGMDEPAKWMLTGYSGNNTAKDVNTLIDNWIRKNQLGAVVPMKLKAVKRTGGGNEYYALKAFPSAGTPEGMEMALKMQAENAQYSSARFEENLPPATDEPGF